MVYYEAKRSKFYVAVGCISAVILLAGLLVALIFASLNLSHNYERFDDIFGNIFAISISSIWITVIIIIVTCELIVYKKQTDIYTRDRMYRKMGDKIIFELEYSKISRIRNGYFGAVRFFCEEPIKRTDKKKAQKVIDEYYSQKDTANILRLIRENCPEVDCIY